MRIETAVGSLLVAGALLAPSLAPAAPLPKDGGDPAKAYRACLDALGKNDKDAVVAACFAKNDPWLAKTNVGYFTPETFSVEVRQLRPDYRLVDVTISGGEVNGDQATLKVSGKMRLQRVESWGEITEVSQDPVKGTVTMRRAAEGWRPAGGDVTRVVN